MNDSELFAFLREMLVNRKTSPLTQAEVNRINAILHPTTAYVYGSLTEKMCLEILGHEAIVREAYKDSVGVWTWSAGITDKSGHGVLRYKDKPQTMEHCLTIYVWLLRTKYAKEVARAFAGYDLTEAQFTAALSFHWNTGAIGSASWVAAFKQGNPGLAQTQFMDWRRPASIIPRREAERDLFFKGIWTNDGKTSVYEVNKPSYSPKWSSLKKVDIRNELRAALAAE